MPLLSLIASELVSLLVASTLIDDPFVLTVVAGMFTVANTLIILVWSREERKGRRHRDKHPRSGRDRRSGDRNPHVRERKRREG